MPPRRTTTHAPNISEYVSYHDRSCHRTPIPWSVVTWLAGWRDRIIRRGGNQFCGTVAATHSAPACTRMKRLVHAALSSYSWYRSMAPGAPGPFTRSCTSINFMWFPSDSLATLDSGVQERRSPSTALALVSSTPIRHPLCAHRSLARPFDAFSKRRE